MALSANGNIALIGENQYSFQNGMPGKAYIFTRSGGLWTQQATLVANDGATNDFFGGSVALNAAGDTALIGAKFKDESGTTNNGAAYIFTQVDGTWVQQAKLLAADQADSDVFGFSVALSSDGNVALIGAY